MDHVTYFWNFRTPSISRERLELETSNLAIRLITMGTNERNAKLSQRGSERGHVTYCWNFWFPSISRERLELETSNLARRFITMGTNERNVKLGQRGQKGVTWFTFKILGLPLYLGNCWSYKRQIWRADSSPAVLTKKCKTRSKGIGRGHVTCFCNFGTPPYVGNGWS